MLLPGLHIGLAAFLHALCRRLSALLQPGLEVRLTGFLYALRWGWAALLLTRLAHRGLAVRTPMR